MFYQDLGFSYKILLPLEFLDEISESLTSFKNNEILDQNLFKILTEKSRNIQDSYQEFQEFLHWESTMRSGAATFSRKLYQHAFGKKN